ncbi:hypothetical protein V3W47_00285 [Deinococcus sp. YIM 134068]|uniref:hypothetical protein n=1 Tax=Deinococcus lichenicola TaxID=3118910 RepID=UPI002F93C48B
MDEDIHESASGRALENLKWMVKLWRRGYKNGAAFDLDSEESETFESHPDVLTLRELEKLGYVKLYIDDLMVAGWTVAADLTEKGIRLAERSTFEDDVPLERFPFP